MNEEETKKYEEAASKYLYEVVNPLIEEVLGEVLIDRPPSETLVFLIVSRF